MNWIGSAITGLIGLLGIVTTYLAGGRDLKSREKTFKADVKAKQMDRIFTAYNAVLKYDGENYVVDIPPHDTLDIKQYKGNIRSVLFPELHIIHKDVRESVHKMDDIIKDIEVLYEDGDDATAKESKAALMYWDMIALIKNHYEKDA